MRTTKMLLLSFVLVLPVSADGPKAPEEVVEAFHAAMVAGDSERVLSFLDPAVMIFESGYAEVSRDRALEPQRGDLRFRMPSGVRSSPRARPLARRQSHRFCVVRRR